MDKDLIDRQRMLDELDEMCFGDVEPDEVDDSIKLWIAMQPAVHERQRGHWEKPKLVNRIRGVMLFDYQCDQCKCVADYDFDYCPNCGADMREDGAAG